MTADEGRRGKASARGAFDAAAAAAFWAALAGGSVLLAAIFLALPASLLALAWCLFLGGPAAAFALAVIASRAGGRGAARTLLDGVRGAVGWIVGFLP